MTGDERATTPSRWFRALARMFPQRDRDGRVAEMLDALEVNRGTSTVRESLSLIWAAAVAWRRYSFSRDGVQQAAFAGAVIWLGLLVGLGPTVRLGLATREGGALLLPGLPTSSALHVTAALCLIAALTLVAAHRRFISRFSTWMLFPVGVIAAAATNRVGEFQLLRSLAYEARWLGLAFGLAVAVRPAKPWRWPVLVALSPAVLFVLIPPGHQYRFNLGRNYGTLLRNGFDGYLGRSNWVDGLVVLALVAAIVLPFFLPAVAAFFVVPALGILVAPTARVAPSATISTILIMGLYLGLVALWNYRRPKLHVSFRRQEHGKRFDLSVDLTSNKRRW